jgi:putative membrane protein (TIGR04086 family)
MSQQAAQGWQQMIPRGGPSTSVSGSSPAPGSGVGLVIGLILAAALIAGEFLTSTETSQPAAILFLGAVVALPLIGGFVVARARRSFLAGVNVGWVSGLILAITSALVKVFLLHGSPSLIRAAEYLILCLVAGIVGGLLGRLFAGRGS